MKKRIAVLTTGRQDWGILRSTCAALRAESSLELCLLAGGMHCSERHGLTVKLLEAEGFTPAEHLPWVEPEEGAPVYLQTGSALQVVGRALERQKPDALVLVGDRFETAAAALAATLVKVPIVHLHGGEETEGAFDNAFRHAITKLSHLHLVTHEEHRLRVVAMGEDPSAVHWVGAPGLDNIHREDLPGRAELEAGLGLALKPPLVVVTLHSATLGGDPAQEAQSLVDAMDQVPATYIITLPNTDPGGDAIRRILLGAVRPPSRIAVEALGEKRFWGLLRLADAVLGNSSSALIEAPVLQLPAVNIGTRQKGRVRGANVLDAPAEPGAIAQALRRALDPAFRRNLQGTTSPFGDGRSAARIVGLLRAWTPPHPPIKPPVPISRG